LRHFWYHLKGLLKGFLWPFRLLKLVKYSWSYGPNEVCDTILVVSSFGRDFQVSGRQLSLQELGGLPSCFLTTLGVKRENQ